MEPSSPPPILFPRETDLQTTLRTALRKDTHRILSEWTVQPDKTWSGFQKGCWERLDCRLMLVVRPEEVEEDWFMEAMFDTCLEELFASEEEEWMVGALYTLYALHQSQPGDIPIPISRRIWNKLSSLCQSSPEASKILKILSGLDALNFVAMTPSESLGAHESHLARQKDLLGPSPEAARLLSIDLAAVERAMTEATPAIYGAEGRVAVGLDVAERTYLGTRTVLAAGREELAAMMGERMRPVVRDLLQAQRDWEISFKYLQPMQQTVKHRQSRQQSSSSSTSLPTSSSASSASTSSLSNRKSAAEQVRRPSPTSAPTQPPEYIISAEHMPSLF